MSSTLQPLQDLLQRLKNWGLGKPKGVAVTSPALQEGVWSGAPRRVGWG